MHEAPPFVHLAVVGPGHPPPSAVFMIRSARRPSPLDLATGGAQRRSSVSAVRFTPPPVEPAVLGGSGCVWCGLLPYWLVDRANFCLD